MRAAAEAGAGPAQQDLHAHRRRRRDRPGRRLARLQGRSALAAIGDVDEANSAIGVALLHVDGRRGARDARRASRTNCSISAPISPRPARISRRRDDAAHRPGADRAARARDRRDERGARAAAQLHPARRRRRRGRSSISPARSCAAPSARRSRRRARSLNPLALTYLNRLSDHLFVLARWVARERGRRHSLAAGRDARRLTRSRFCC